MKLTVENLGAIKSGEISFDKNLIILTGPNNTGKSYLTYLIHGIHKINTLIDPNKAISLFDNHFKNIEPIEKLIELNQVELNNIVSAYKNDVSQVLNEIITNNFIKIFASNNIKPSINIEVDHFNLNGPPSATAVIGYDIVDNKAYSKWNDGTISEQAVKLEPNADNMTLYCRIITGMYFEELSPFGESYIFPAERTSINLFARDIVAKKAGSRDDLALRVLAGEDITEIARSISQEQNNTPKYPLSINDYINFVYTFNGSDIKSKISFLADEFESIVLGGTIAISEFQQPVFKPTDSEQALNLHESSSLIKSLSYLVIYLRYFAKKGDWVLIDEPEINLHPNLQVAIAKIFARMINAGLKIILSTHSDYLVKELNTLIMLHDLSKEKKNLAFIKQHGYTISDTLDKTQVGAYYINNGQVTPLEVEERGIYVDSIDRTITNIDNFTEEIFFKIQTQKKYSNSKKGKAL